MRDLHRTALRAALTFSALALATQAQAAILTGTVQDMGGNPIVNVDVDLEDPNGMDVPLTMDTTDLNGVFMVTVPDNLTYEVTLEPPAATRLLVKKIPNVVVTAGTVDLGTTTLDPGVLLQGTLLRSADNLPAPGVKLEVRDSNGTRIPIVGDNSDLLGEFSSVVPAGTIELQVLPPKCDRLVPRRITGIVIVADTNLGNILLDSGGLLSGTLVRSDMTPVGGADTDVKISLTRATVFTPNDDTDPNGLFELVVPLATVDLDLEPRKVDRLVAQELTGIPMVGDNDLGTIVLEDGAFLTGTVVRASDGTTPVVDADTDTDNSMTGQRIPTPDDNTGPSGAFCVVVPLTTVDLTIEPKKSDRLVALTLVDIQVLGDTDLGTIQLEDGALLSGTVLRSSDGTPVVNADTDAADAFTGVKIPTPGDNTDANGDFSIVVPLGTIQLCVEPQTADRLVAIRMVDVDITGDTNLGTFILNDGFLISGTVQDPSGVAAGVSVAAYDSTTGERVPTPQSQSRPDGTYSFILPSGTFNLKWSPPLGQGTARLFVNNFMVTGDQVFNPPLQASTVSTMIGDAGHLVDAGGFYKFRVFVLNNTAVSAAVRVLLQAEVPSLGRTRDIVPPIDTPIPPNGRVQRGQFRLRIPAGLHPRFRGIPIYMAISVLDQITLTLIDKDFIEFQIR